MCHHERGVVEELRSGRFCKLSRSNLIFCCRGKVPDVEGRQRRVLHNLRRMAVLWRCSKQSTLDTTSKEQGCGASRHSTHQSNVTHFTLVPKSENPLHQGLDRLAIGVQADSQRRQPYRLPPPATTVLIAVANPKPQKTLSRSVVAKCRHHLAGDTLQQLPVLVRSSIFELPQSHTRSPH